MVTYETVSKARVVDDRSRSYPQSLFRGVVVYQDKVTLPVRNDEKGLVAQAFQFGAGRRYRTKFLTVDRSETHYIDVKGSKAEPLIRRNLHLWEKE